MACTFGSSDFCPVCSGKEKYVILILDRIPVLKCCLFQGTGVPETLSPSPWLQDQLLPSLPTLVTLVSHSDGIWYLAKAASSIRRSRKAYLVNPVSCTRVEMDQSLFILDRLCHQFFLLLLSL